MFKKKVISLFLTLSMLTISFLPSLIPTAAASEGFSYGSEAKVLNDLGLYKGISTTTFNPDLGAALNRETGVVLLLRIFGLEEAALALSAEDTAAVLAKYTDVTEVDGWAKKQMAYAVQNGLVKGVSATEIGPKSPLSGKMYCTLILRQLGYEADYANAASQLADNGGLTETQGEKFRDAELIKDDLVGISFGSLKAKYTPAKGGKEVIEKLVEAKVVDEKAAAEAGLVTPAATITELAQVPSITVEVGGTVNLPATIKATYSDKTTIDAEVTWGTVDTTKPAKVTVQGTVVGTDLKASADVEVVKVDPVDVPISYGTMVTIPDTTTVEYLDGTKVVNVLWNTQDKQKVDSSKPGSTDVNGIIEGTTLKAIAHVTVGARPYVVSAENPNPITATAGETVTLPPTVRGTYNNRDVRDVNVTWNAVDTSKVGEQNVQGTVTGTSITVNVKVTLNAPECYYTKFDVKDGATNQPIQITPQFSKDSTSYKATVQCNTQNVIIDLDKNDPNAKTTIKIGDAEPVEISNDDYVAINDLQGGANNIELTIFNSSSSKTYSLQILRMPKEFPILINEGFIMPVFDSTVNAATYMAMPTLQNDELVPPSQILIQLLPQHKEIFDYLGLTFNVQVGQENVPKELDTFCVPISSNSNEEYINLILTDKNGVSEVYILKVQVLLPLPPT